MKTLTIHEALAFNPRSSGPRVSLYLGPKQLSSNPEKAQAFIRQCAQQASALIKKSYGIACAKHAEQSIEESLQKASEILRYHRGSLGFFWTKEANRIVKIPTLVETLLVVSDSFHVKTLMAAGQSKGDFVVIYLSGFSIELARVEAHRISHLKSIAISPSALPSARGEHLATSIAETLRDAFTLGTLPILISGHDPMMGKVASDLQEQLAPLEIALVRKNLVLGFQSVFAAAREIMNPYFIEQQKRTVELLTNDREYNILGLSGVAEALLNKDAKEVFLAHDATVWGRFDTERGEIVQHKLQKDGHDSDILNELALLATQLGVPVHLIPKKQLPNNAMAVALRTNRKSLKQGSKSILKLISA